MGLDMNLMTNIDDNGLKTIAEWHNAYDILSYFTQFRDWEVNGENYDDPIYLRKEYMMKLYSDCRDILTHDMKPENSVIPHNNTRRVIQRYYNDVLMTFTQLYPIFNGKDHEKYDDLEFILFWSN
ncbi:hypothetical protein [Methanobrevibacter sp. DSM 116169]|uniref:hypothetical protein n=1 Tax=Methanobrevibacter sp. DSM 116169 TaxID=3242727 RepID=UPI0038FC849A